MFDSRNFILLIVVSLHVLLSTCAAVSWSIKFFWCCRHKPCTCWRTRWARTRQYVQAFTMCHTTEVSVWCHNFDAVKVKSVSKQGSDCSCIGHSTTHSGHIAKKQGGALGHQALSHLTFKNDIIEGHILGTEDVGKYTGCSCGKFQSAAILLVSNGPTLAVFAPLH